MIEAVTSLLTAHPGPREKGLWEVLHVLLLPLAVGGSDTLTCSSFEVMELRCES